MVMDMTKLYDIIEMIIDNPEKYIRRRSVQRLYAFLGGYLEGHPEANDHCLNGFSEYVEEHYSMCASLNWADFIEFKAVSDCEEMELFKKHFRNFVALRGEGCESEKIHLPHLPTEKTTLSDLIAKILKRPELYIGRCSVQRLYAFLDGFLFENETANDHCLDGFDQYVAIRHSGTSGHNWADVIELFSSTNYDEIVAFKKHFEKYTQHSTD